MLTPPITIMTAPSGVRQVGRGCIPLFVGIHYGTSIQKQKFYVNYENGNCFKFHFNYINVALAISYRRFNRWLLINFSFHRSHTHTTTHNLSLLYLLKAPYGIAANAEAFGVNSIHLKVSLHSVAT